MLKKIVIFIMVVLVLMPVIPVYSTGDIISTTATTEHVFTKSELAGDNYVDTSDCLTTSDGFISINCIEGKALRSSTSYYLAERSNGFMLTSKSSGKLSWSRYPQGDSNSHDYQKWIFSQSSDGYYFIYSNIDTTKCLTVDPTTLSVTLSTYTGSQYQKWGMYFANAGNALKSMAHDDRVSGYKIVFDGTNCSVSNSTYTPFGFIDVSWYVPCTSLSFSDIYISAGESIYVYPTYLPSNSNCHGSNWTRYQTSSFQIFSVSTDGKITAKKAGVATLTIMDKITRVTNTADVFVYRLPNPDAQNKTNWCWAAAAKMVGEHNGGDGLLTVGNSLLSDTNGVNSYNGVDFFGETYFGALTVDTGQRQIVVSYYGNDENWPGSNAAKEYALSMSSYDTMRTITLGDGLSYGLNSTNIAAMNKDLAAGRWVIGNVFTYGANVIGHSIVIQSYNTSTEIYTYWDPQTNENGTFTKTQLDSNTIKLNAQDSNRILAWIQRCY